MFCLTSYYLPHCYYDSVNCPCIVRVTRVPTHLISQGIFLVRESRGKVREFCWQSGKTGHDYPCCASVVVTDQLRHTRSFIGAYSSKSMLSVIVLVFLKIMAMERSRCRGGVADYKLHKTSSSICIGSGNSSKHSQGKSGKSRNFIFEFESEPCDSIT